MNQGLCKISHKTHWLGQIVTNSIATIYPIFIVSCHEKLRTGAKGKEELSAPSTFQWLFPF